MKKSFIAAISLGLVTLTACGTALTNPRFSRLTNFKDEDLREATTILNTQKEELINNNRRYFVTTYMVLKGANLGTDDINLGFDIDDWDNNVKEFYQNNLKFKAEEVFFDYDEQYLEIRRNWLAGAERTIVTIDENGEFVVKNNVIDAIQKALDGVQEFINKFIDFTPVDLQSQIDDLYNSYIEDYKAYSSQCIFDFGMMDTLNRNYRKITDNNVLSGAVNFAKSIVFGSSGKKFENPTNHYWYKTLQCGEDNGDGNFEAKFLVNEPYAKEGKWWINDVETTISSNVEIDSTRELSDDEAEAYKEQYGPVSDEIIFKNGVKYPYRALYPIEMISNLKNFMITNTTVERIKSMDMSFKNHRLDTVIMDQLYAETVSLDIPFFHDDFGITDWIESQNFHFGTETIRREEYKYDGVSKDSFTIDGPVNWILDQI